MPNNEFYFSSVTKNIRMRAVEWLPAGEPKAVLHIFHEAEKAAYSQAEPAEFFKEHGFVVIESSCPDPVSADQIQEAMHTCVVNVKRKYPDVPYLLLGCSQGAVTVTSFVKNYPGAVEGVVLADAELDPLTSDQEISVLCVFGLAEKRRETLQRIYQWTEERLDEMLYRVATKH